MNNNEGKKRHNSYIALFIRNLLSLKSDKAPEEETIASIKAGIDFRGANLWILIFAIFVASLGLNTNSAAVIIGAMLISPLMGPIVGMGLGVGINDFELLKSAFRSFATATLFSVLTATFYFLITPIDDAQSELLARTSPTIYDVLIALFGGLAGIVALCSTGQRGGNVIPGVAIATALMPPLCTTGFGLATGNWIYAAGAFYLYLINTIFISVATFIGVTIMDFKKKHFVDKQREKKVRHIIITITILTMLPATLLTFMLVKEDIYNTRVNDFISECFNSNKTLVISKETNYRERTIRLVTLGEEIPQEELAEIKAQLADFGLEKAELTIVQGTKNMDANKLKSMLTDPAIKQADHNAQLLIEERKKNERLTKQVNTYKAADEQAQLVSREMATLFPEVAKVCIANTKVYQVEKESKALPDSVTLVSITLRKQLSTANREKMEEWLSSRLDNTNIKLVVGTKIETNNKNN